MLIEQRPARWWNLLNRACRTALLNGAIPWNFYPLVNTYPKSGGTWLAQMLAEALELPNPRRRLPMLRSSMMHGHILHPGWMKDIVMVWRDARDVMVSFYYHLVAENNFAGKIAKDHTRKLMAVSDVNDIRANLPRFIELSSEGRLHPWFGWGESYRRWHAHPKVLAQTRYEEMLADAGGELFRIQAVLGGGRNEEECRAIAARFSFERQANRRPGVAENTSSLRKGVSGDWLQYFSPAARRTFDHYAGDALVALGYEPDKSWVDADASLGSLSA